MTKFERSMILLGLFLVCLPASAPAQGCAAAPKGMSAWFTFDEPMFARASKTSGITGSALRFDGSTQFFEFPANLPDVKVGSGDFSVELWIRTKEAVKTRNVVDFRSYAPLGYLLFVRAGAVGMQVVDGVELSNAIASSYSIADGRWHHAVGVVKRLPPQSPAIYVDGVQRAQNGRSVSLSNLDHDAPMWLGRHRRNGYIDRDNMYFAGDLDELTIYRRALSAVEIQTLFRAGAKGKCRK